MIKTQPTVLKKDGKPRKGKGFSKEELKKAGLNITQARKLGVPVDSRRRTIHDENVEIVKTLFENKKTATKTKRKSKSQITS